MSSSVAQAGLFGLVRRRAELTIRETIAFHWRSVTGNGLPPSGIRMIAASAKPGSAASKGPGDQPGTGRTRMRRACWPASVPNPPLR
jgi:hypothetical protein